MKRLFTYLLIISGTLSTWSQMYEISRYADDNGLPSRIVHDVTQDSLGRLWVAGNNGLYHFDGQKFYGYYASLQDTTGLRNNRINTVLADRSGVVWVATPSGLHQWVNGDITYVPLAENTSGSANHITALFEDRRGDLWVGTYDGLFVLDKDTRAVTSVPIPGQREFDDDTIWSISQDGRGRIWVCRARQAPVIAEEGSLNFRVLNWRSEQLDVSEINPFKYIEYDPETILISSGSGLLKAQIESDSLLLVEPFRDESGGVAASYFMYQTIVDSEKNIWTVTWKNYFHKYRIEDGNLIKQEVISKNGYLGMSGFCRSIFEDAQKNIWIANSNGLYKLSKNVGKLHAFPPSHISDCLNNVSIYGFAEDQNGNLWINTPTDLYRIKKQDILNNRCPEDMLHFQNEHFTLARDLLVDSKNRLWISGQGGLSVTQLDAAGNPGAFTHITSKNGLPHTWCTGIIEIGTDEFWVGNYIRLVKMTLPDGDYRKPVFDNYNSDEQREDALVNSYVVTVTQDQDGSLWAGTFSGLSKMVSDGDEGSFDNYVSEFGNEIKLSNNSIKKVFKDRQGRMWIGTQTGLNLYLPESNTFKQFGRADGLPSEYILGIDEDSEGNLWVATTQGMFKGIYNASMQDFVHIEYYTTREGLADNITNRNALHIDNEDNVFIGSSQGVSVFSGSKGSILARPFNLAISTLESTRKGENGFETIKDQLVNNELRLAHYENSIQLSYAVLDFTDPGYNSYRHKFLPVHEEWIETGNNAQLTYYNLAPGTYELWLDGSNNQGIWSTTPLKITLHIAPPFWKSTWAYAIYLLAVLGLLRYLYLMRIRRRMRELEQETRLEKALIREREQLRNENAADFHDELGSKVTKISMFLTLAERTLQEKKDPSSWLGKMRDNIKDLSGSFRDLLWVIDPQKDSLSDAIIRLKDFGEELFENTKVRYTTSGYSEELEEKILDPQTKKQVVLIFKEALHNCAKYAESTLVELTVESNGGFSSIVLKDNGKGFNVHRQGKGRGLSNMKTRSEKIGGNLSIISSEEGTVVTLHRIPHLRDDQEDND